MFPSISLLFLRWKGASIAKGAHRQVQGGATAPPGFCFKQIFIHIFTVSLSSLFGTGLSRPILKNLGFLGFFCSVRNSYIVYQGRQSWGLGGSRPPDFGQRKSQGVVRS